MKGIALLLVLAVIISLALREIVERNFETEIQMAQEEAKKAEEAAGSAQGPQQPAASMEFRGPTGKPQIIGPSAPPPGY